MLETLFYWLIGIGLAFDLLEGWEVSAVGNIELPDPEKVLLFDDELG